MSHLNGVFLTVVNQGIALVGGSTHRRSTLISPSPAGVCRRMCRPSRDTVVHLECRPIRREARAKNSLSTSSLNPRVIPRSAGTSTGRGRVQCPSAAAVCGATHIRSPRRRTFYFVVVSLRRSPCSPVIMANSSRLADCRPSSEAIAPRPPLSVLTAIFSHARTYPFI